MENYTILENIGEGAHGVVVKARKKSTAEIVALKKIHIKKIENGIPIRLFREVKALQHLDYEHVIKLIDFFPYGMGFVLVLEYMISDVSQVLKAGKLSEGCIKAYMIMLLKGISHCHRLGIIHRGETDIDQLSRVIKVLGTPTEESWPGHTLLPDFHKIHFSQMDGILLKEIFPTVGEAALALIHLFLQYDEKKRISAADPWQLPIPETKSDQKEIASINHTGR